MASSRQRVHASINAFSDELQMFSSHVSNSVQLFKRTMATAPSSGAREFNQVLQDMGEEVSTISQELEMLEKFTVDSVSFEELIGHCCAVYDKNRNMALDISEHLEQQGHPAVQLQQKEDPMSSWEHKASKVEGRWNDAGERQHEYYDQMQEDMAPEYEPASKKAPRLKQDAEGGFSYLGAPTHQDVVPVGTRGTQVTGFRAAARSGSGGPGRSTGEGLGRHARPSLDSVISSSSMGDALLLSPSLMAMANKYADPCSGGKPNDRYKDPTTASEARGSRGGVPERELTSEELEKRLRSVGINSPFLVQDSLAKLNLSSDSPKRPTHQVQQVKESTPSIMSKGLIESLTPLTAEIERGGRSPNTPSALLGDVAAGFNPQQANSTDTDDTFTLYQQLIHAKETPTSVTARSAAVAAGHVRPGHRTPDTAATAPHSTSQLVTPTNASSALLRRSVSVQGSARRSASVQRASSVARSRQSTEGLATKLADLEAMWVGSGQAALTPRKASGAPASMFVDVKQGGPSSASSKGGTAAAVALAPTNLSHSTSMPGVWPLPVQMAPAPASGRLPQGVQPGMASLNLSPGTSDLISRAYGSGISSDALHQIGAAKAHTVADAVAPQEPEPDASWSFKPHPAVSQAAPQQQQQPQLSPLLLEQSGPILQVEDAEYQTLPGFCRSQLPLPQFNAALRALNQLINTRLHEVQTGSGGVVSVVTQFSLVDVEQCMPGLPQKAKVLGNCLVKLGRVELQSCPGGGFNYSVK